MGKGSEWILFVARRIAEIDGAVTGIMAPPSWVLPVMTLGLIWAVLWQGRARLGGLAVVGLSLWSWSQAERPALLVSADARLAGLMGVEGRALSKAVGGGFAAKTWLENDGDLAAQADAAARAGFQAVPEGQRFTLGATTGILLSPRFVTEGRDLCELAAIVVTKAQGGGSGCLLVTADTLGDSGAVAIYPDLTIIVTRSARRLWSPPQ